MTGQRTRHSGPAIPQEVPPLRLRHHRHRWSISGRGYFKRLGPGIVTGADDDDPSGIGTYSQVGAAYGYGILWSALLTVAMASAMLALEIFLSYHRYARILRFLALALLAYVLVLFTIHVDWTEVLRGFLVPNLDGGKAELAALIAVFGTTVSPYLFFWQASEEVEEESEGDGGDQDGPGPVTGAHLTAMRVDVAGGMVSAVGIASAIMITTAATLHARGITDIATADQAARALRPLAGDFAGLLFAIGIVG
ncbi:MAG: divalent metal cation transporter, partial [Acidimicrobiia bacterium]